MTDCYYDGRITRIEIERRAHPSESYEDAEHRLEAEERQTSGGESGAATAPAQTPTERRDAPEQVARDIENLRAAIEDDGCSGGN